MQTNYPNPLYEGESADAANKSAYPKTFSEPLTFELYKHHQEISELPQHPEVIRRRQSPGQFRPDRTGDAASADSAGFGDDGVQ